MTESQGSNGTSNKTTSEHDLRALLESAEQVRDRAKAARLEFVAYLAEMTVLELNQEIARQSGPKHK